MHKDLEGKCRLCNSSSLEVILELGNMPAKAQYFPKERGEALSLLANLNIRQCTSCGLVQILGQPVDYYREVLRSNKVSGSMRDFRLTQIGSFVKQFSLESGLILEAGCGSGDILEILRDLECNFYGMEFNNEFIRKLHLEGYSVIHGYPDDTLTSYSGPLFNGFLAFNVLEHAPSPRNFLLGLRKMLQPDAVGIVEVPNFDMIIFKNMISEFMLEHMTYFTKTTLRHTLEFCGFEVLELHEVWNDYLISAVVKKRSIFDFSLGVKEWQLLTTRLKEFLREYKRSQVCIWGAGHQSLASISILGLSEHVGFIVDSSPSKQGKYAPASGLPIVSQEHLKISNDIDCVIVLGGSYSQEIIEDLIVNYSNHLRILTLDGTDLVIVR